MTNKITASIEFYFKGKHFTPSVKLDLDDIMTTHRALPELHPYLARLHAIDTYSYEYEMMLAEDIQFSNAQGWAAEFVSDGQFDHITFEQKWLDQETLHKLNPIIKQELDIDDLSQHPALKNVIMAAYNLGKNN